MRPAEELQPRRSRRDLLLDAAARVFNRAGVSQASLSEIGAGLGVTRAALYYYAEDREDLLFQCYRRACEVQARDLEAAAKGDGGARAQLIDYVRRGLDPERPEAAALCEVALLSDERREIIDGLRHANRARLCALIEDGVRAGDIRPCVSIVVAEAIAGMLAWGPLAPRWSDSAAAAPDLARIRDGAVELLTYGIARDAARRRDLPTPPSFAPLSAHGSLFDREAATALKTEEVLRAASRLFNRKGVDATSLDEIAAAIGATKGAVYHYLADKPSLVARCYDRAFDMSERVFELSRAHNGDGFARSIIGYRLLVGINLDPLCAPLAPFVGLDTLKAEDRTRLRRRITKLETIYPKDAERGVADGSIRLIDLQAVAVASAGAFGWLPKWAHDQDGIPPAAIADELTRLFAFGLAPEGPA